jgi:hypothetical protein
MLNMLNPSNDPVVSQASSPRNSSIFEGVVPIVLLPIEAIDHRPFSAKTAYSADGHS